MQLTEKATLVLTRLTRPEAAAGERWTCVSQLRALAETDALWMKPEQEAALNLSRRLQHLFKSEPEQPGAAKIALKLSCRAADVRAMLAAFIEDGLIEAIGTTRDRRYRRIREESRPA